MSQSKVWKSYIAEENTNYLRSQLVLMKVGRKVLWELYFTRLPKTRNIREHLYITYHKDKLHKLKDRKVIQEDQWNQLFPEPTPESWDLALIIILLQNICGIRKPKDWKKVEDTDFTLQADLVRLKNYRKDICGHSAEPHLTTESFHRFKDEITKLLIRVAKNIDRVNTSIPFFKDIQEDIDVCFMAPLDPFYVKDMLDETKQWINMHFSQNMNAVNSEIEKIHEKLQKIDDDQDFVKSDLSKLKCNVNELKDSMLDQTQNINQSIDLQRAILSKFDEKKCQNQKTKNYTKQEGQDSIAHDQGLIQTDPQNQQTTD